MSQIDTIKREIQRAIITGLVTKRELARQACIPETTLIGLEKPAWSPTAKTLASLEIALAEIISERKRRPKKAGHYQPAA